ncbi:MAG: formylglycine-generating enzyme family protein, partial [Thiothrix litoralis]|uniref:formylglycine-generating enzyme family protein n=1 Tax=Thiothrix litoralis TaxID=2891210 RepID=UPI003C73A89C
DQPGGRYYDWFDQQQAVKAWQPLKAPSVVLVISDLGQLSAQGSVVCQGWLRFAQQLARQGIRPLVLSPVSPAQQYAPFTAVLDQIPWGKLSRFQPQKPNSQQQEHASHVQRVLGLLSVAVHVEPELLRAILGCLPAIQADSGVEAAVYLHSDVVWGYTAMTLRAEKRAAYQALFRQESVSLQREVLALIRQHHIGQFPAVWAETVLNAKPLTAFALDDAAWAEQFMVRFTRSFAGQSGHEGMAQFARRHLQRLGKDQDGNAFYQASYASALYGLAYREQVSAGAEVPALYDAGVVQSVISHQQDLKEYLVTQVGEYLYLAIDTGSTSEMLIGSLLGEMTCRRNVIGLSMDGKKTLVPLQTQTPLCHLIDAEDIQLDTGLERLHISQFTKPSWAHEIVRHREALDAIMYFAGERYRFQLIQLTAREEPLAGDYWGKIEGNDRVGFDSYGLYADLNIKDIPQRFRWIAPGTFLMGSPESEAEREWNGQLKGSETQHPVTLTQGFWLADTTVTQSLWQAVMGKNPRSFTDNPNNPVEQVSWDDTQEFIKKLNGLLPGLQAKLPTEAQWEYACRAGTTTPFSFGDNITPEQVNYDGNYPYANGEKGLYRKKTVPVKSLPANPWGLYEMHGNVWEWCQDVWQEKLPASPVTDPEGVAGGDQGAGVERVVRGGSWLNGGRDVRSAIRLRGDPALRNGHLGFRLALGLELRSGQGGGAAEQERADGSDAGRRVAGDTADRGSVGSGDKPTVAERVTEYVAEGLKGFTNLFRKKK